MANSVINSDLGFWRNMQLIALVFPMVFLPACDPLETGRTVVENIEIYFFLICVAVYGVFFAIVYALIRGIPENRDDTEFKLALALEVTCMLFFSLAVPFFSPRMSATRARKAYKRLETSERYLKRQ